MESLLNIIVVIVSGGIGLFLFRLLRPTASVKQNQEVINKVNEKTEEITDILSQIKSNVDSTKKQTDDLEKEKKKDLSKEQMEDFFNNRKH